jgi:hypothetical protein
MSCRKNCSISEGYQQSVLGNDRCKVIHGMVTRELALAVHADGAGG